MIDYIHLKQQFPSHWMLLKKKLAHPYEYYKNLQDYEKPIEKLIESRKEAYFRKVENKCPDQEEIHRTNEIISSFLSKVDEN